MACFSLKSECLLFRGSCWLVDCTHRDVGLNFLAREPSHLIKSQIPSLSNTDNNKSHGRTGLSKQSLQNIN